MIKKKYYIVFLFLFSYFGFSQNTDFQARFIGALEYKINKKWEVLSEYRYALENDLYKFRSSAFQLESKYKINKKLSLDGGYRFTTSFEEDNHRFFVGIGYNYKIDKITLLTNSKFQYSTNSFDPDFINKFKSPVIMFRQKLGIDYNIPKSKFSLNSGVEIFLKLSSQPFSKFNRTRYSIGTDYNFKKYGKLGLCLFYDDKYNPSKDDRFVFVTKYSYSLNKSKKKKEKKTKKG